MRWLLPMALLMGCNPDPGEADQQVGYRDGLDDGVGDNGERGNTKVSEILWSGSVAKVGDEYVWDPDDVFVEIRNEGNRPVNLTGWFLMLEGAREVTWRFPQTDFDIQPGEHRFIAAKEDGCFIDPDWVIPSLSLPYGGPLELTLRDLDERLIEPAGSEHREAYAGGYDLVVSRSMEKVELMFGGRGSQPESWHHYTEAEVDVPNRDKIKEACRERTLASPGRPNSPDYSGAFSSGALE